MLELRQTAASASIAQNTDDSTRQSISASEFVEKAGTGGLAEVEMGEPGAQKATSGQVKAMMDKFREAKAGKEFDRNYVERMVKDHKTEYRMFETAAGDAAQTIQSRLSD